MEGRKPITIVSATEIEVAAIRQYFKKTCHEVADNCFTYGDQIFHLLITGVGSLQTAVNLGKYCGFQQPKLLIHTGIAGAYTTNLALGDVVFIRSDRIADLGAEDKDGSFLDVFGLKLVQPDQDPFRDGLLINPQLPDPPFLPMVDGITVNTVTGQATTVDRWRKRYNPDIETMESAAFFYHCLSYQLPFMSIRSISNYVTERDRDSWKIELSLDNLTHDLITIIDGIATASPGVEDNQ